MQTTITPRIYVACLASYNAGILHGAWIDADQDADDIQAEVAAMLRKSPHPNVLVECPKCEGDGCDDCKGTGKVASAEEWAIHDYEGFGGIKIDEHDSFEHVAAVAEALDSIDNPDAFAVWFANGTADDDPTTWAEAFEDAFMGEYASLGEWAEEYCDDCGILSEMPESLRCYFDFEAFGRDAQCGGDIWYSDGYVFRNC